MEIEFGVAVKAVIYNENKFLVIFKSDKEDVNPKTFDLPGGRIRFNEKLEDALKREVMEEVGVEIKVLGITDAWTFVKNDKFELVGITYVCKALTNEVKLSFEHSSFEWVDSKDKLVMNQYPKWLTDSIKRALKIIDEE